MCTKFMKWEWDRNEKSCSDAGCGKLHNLICTKSLDLKCLVKACPYKVHTLKCHRVTSVKTKEFGTGGGRHSALGAQSPRNLG